MPTPGGGKPLRIFVKLDAAGAGTDLGKQLASAFNQQTNAIRSTVGTSLKLMQREVKSSVDQIVKELARIGAAGGGAGGGPGGGGGGKRGGGPTGLDKVLSAMLNNIKDEVRRQATFSKKGLLTGQAVDLVGDEGSGRSARVRYDRQGRAVSLTIKDDADERERAAQRVLRVEQGLLSGELAIARRRSDLQRQKMREDQQQYDQLERLAKKAATAEAVQGRVQEALSQFGGSMRLTRERLGINTKGQQYGQYTFERQAGLFSNARRGTVNSLTGAVSEEEIHGSSRLGQAWRNLVGDGNRLQQTLHLIGKAGSVMGNALVAGLKAPFVIIDKLRYLAIGLSATFYSVARIGRGLGHIFIDPVKQILNQTEQSREFETAIGGVAGGGGRAAAINQAIRANSRSSPMTLQEMRDIGRQFTLIPALAGGVSTGNPNQVVSKFGDFSKLVSQLAIMDPEQGASGALISLREGLAGEFRSLRTRLELQPEAIASSYGTSTQQMQRDPQLFLKALTHYTDTYVGQDAIDKLGSLYTKRIEKLHDTIRIAAEKIGDSGLFDNVNNMLRDAAQGIFDWVDSDEFKGQAQKLSDSLGNILQNLGKSAVGFLQGLTGDKNAVRGVGSILTQFTVAMSNLSNKLPGLATGLGKGLADIGAGLERSLVVLKTIASGVEHPDQLVKQAERSAFAGAVEESSGAAFYAYSLPFRAAGAANRFAQRMPFRTAGYMAGVAGSFMPPPPAPRAQMTLNDWTMSQQAQLGYDYRADTGKIPQITPDYDVGRLAPFLGNQNNLGVAVNTLLGGFNRSVDLYNPDTQSSIAKYQGIQQQAIQAMGGPGGMLASLNASQTTQYVARLKMMREETSDPEALRAFDWLIGTAESNLDNFRGDLATQLPTRVRNLGFARAAATDEMDPLAAVRILAQIRKVQGPVPEAADLGLRQLTEGMRGLDFEAASPFGGTWEEGFNYNRKFYGRMNEAIQARGGAGFYSDRGLKMAMLRAAMGERGAASASLASAQAGGNPDYIAQAQANFERTSLAVQQLQRQLDDLGQSFVKFGGDVRGAMENGFAKGIESMIKGTGTIKAVLAGLADDVISAFSRMAANNLMQGLFGDFLLPQANGTSGALGGVAKIGLGAAGSAIGGAFGGLFSGWHAKGDVFHGPAIAGLGERGPEAIMPLTRTSSGQLGVVASGGMGSAGTNLIIVDSRAQAQQVAAASPHMINKIVELAERKVAHSIMNGNGPAGQAVKNRRTR